MKKTSYSALCCLLLVLCALPALSLAASHRDWTVVPLGSYMLDGEQQSIQIARPYDRFGVIDAPIILTAVFGDGSALANPVKIEFSAGETKLPVWSVDRVGRIYVIGLDRLVAMAEDGGRTIALNVSVKNAPAKLTLMASGAPELKLVGNAAVGPLDELLEGMEASAAREYLQAVVAIGIGKVNQAMGTLERLAKGEGDEVARFARATLRRLALIEAEATLPNTFDAHFRLALYAQQCGFFRAARIHYSEALRALDQSSERPSERIVSEAWFRLGEMMERCGDPIADVAEVMEKAGDAGHVTPNVWDVWVTILMSRPYEEERDGKKTEVTVDMTPEQVAKIRREWHWVEQMVYGASGGHFQLRTQYREIPNTTVVPYGLNVGWLYGPLDALVPTRGSVDCVMSFHPRGPSVTGGADCGPNGATMTDIGTWCGWEVYLHEWNHQFDWTMRTDEAGEGYPITHNSDSCGHQPIPSMGYGHRASMHYYVTPGMYNRIDPAAPDDGKGYVTYWRVGPPIIVRTPAPTDAGEIPAHHAQDHPRKDWESTLGQPEALGSGFIDLAAYQTSHGFTLADWYLTPATAWVFSPTRQVVRLWLGHNDGMAVWLNDELIHRGDYYAIAKFEDQNWPNMVASAGVLQRGWNRLDVVVESWPAPRDHGHGFSVRLCGLADQPLEGLRFADAKTEVPEIVPSDPLKPRTGRFYRWEEVRSDFYNELPLLTADDLAQRAGVPTGLVLKGQVGATHGYVGLGERDGTRFALPAKWNEQQDVDLRLNNIMDWNREAVAVFPVKGSDVEGVGRYLLLMRPEAIDTYLYCTLEPNGGEPIYDRPLADRVLGYVLVGASEETPYGLRALIVAEAALPEPLPFDEEDLLAPALP